MVNLHKKVSEKSETRRASNTTDRYVALSETKIVFGEERSKETVYSTQTERRKQRGEKLHKRRRGKNDDIARAHSRKVFSVCRVNYSE